MLKPYNLKEDHEAIKRQIKDWENRIDNLINISSSKNCNNLLNELSVISDEMLAINI